MSLGEITRSSIELEHLKITWQTLVVFRDLALEANDFQRALGYTSVIEDIAHMIQHQGGELPEIPKER